MSKVEYQHRARKKLSTFKVICGFVLDFGCKAGEKLMILDGSFIPL